MKHQIHVGNIGCVIDTDSEDEALKGKTDAAHRLLKSCQPLTPPQSRIWARLNRRIHNT